MGVNQDRAKRNKQRAKYRNLEVSHKRLGLRYRGRRWNESEVVDWENNCKVEPERMERKKQKAK